MLRVREAWRPCRRKKSSPKKPCYAPRTRSFCPGGYAAQHTAGQVSAQQKKVGLVVNEYGDIQGLVTVEVFWKRLSAISLPRCRQHLPKGHAAKRRFGDYRWHRQRARNNKAFNWHLPEDDARTVNGVILRHWKRSLSQAPACVLASTYRYSRRTGQYD